MNQKDDLQSSAATSSADRTDQIAADPSFQDDGDSALGDDIAPSTSSIASTILEYRKLHGRTYHNYKDVEYWGPNDEQQNDGLDLNHHKLYLAFDNKLFFAPLRNPQKVLDVGTGTGIWAMYENRVCHDSRMFTPTRDTNLVVSDFATEFPEAEVIGTDLSPTLPNWVPPNCVFELDDASQEWTFPDNTFDYIHIRFMAGCFKDWKRLYSQCFRCLKPGGWLEHQECGFRVVSDDGSLPPDNAFNEAANLFAETGRRSGHTTEVIDDDNWIRWMEEAGFRDVQKKAIKTPMGEWPADKKWKEVGLFNRITTETALEGYFLYKLTRVMGWEYAEVQSWLARVREALRNKAYHGYSTWGIAWVQKPKA